MKRLCHGSNIVKKSLIVTPGFLGMQGGTGIETPTL
jgi:hypothetical protein